MSDLSTPHERISDDQFRQDLTEAVSRLHPVISSQLGEWSTPEEIADVAQASWISAWEARSRFDETVGDLWGWVVTIARRRAIDVVRGKIRENQLRDQVQTQSHGVSTESMPVIKTVDPDPADTVVNTAVDRERIKNILSIVEEVISHREATVRGLALIMVFDDDIKLAAKSLGLSQDCLRRARRELIMCCQVVVKAQHALQDGRPITLRTMIECLPSEDESGQWSREMALICARAGGLGAVTVEHVMDVTAFSYNTARQYLEKSQHLLRVAATVMNQENHHD